MSLDRALAIAGVVLGIPSVIVIFATANVTVAIVSIVMAALLLGAAFYLRTFVNQPPYSFVSATLTLDFTQGVHLGRLQKSYKIRPNFSHLRQIEHKNIAADGEITHICWDGQPVPPEFIQKKMGEYEVRINLEVTPALWRVFDGCLSYDLENSFNASIESLTYCVDFPTKEATIKILFPNNRLCISAETRRHQGAGEMPTDPPTITSDKKELVLKLKKPAYGANYTIYWKW